MITRILLLLRIVAPSLLVWIGPGAAADAQVLPFQTYTTKDGLVTNTITSLYQDSYGYLWIGTTEGISVYDGNMFKNYSIVDGLPNNYINAIVESERTAGVLWIGTNGGGACKWENGKFSVFKVAAESPSNAVNKLLEDRRGVLWCATDGGLYRLDQGNARQIFSDSAWGLNALNDSTFLTSTPHKLYLCDAATGDLRTVPITPPRGTLFTAIGVSGPSEFWVATNAGVLYHFNHWSQPEPIELTGHPAVISLSVDRERNVWLTTSSGVITIPSGQVDVQSMVRYTASNGLLEDVFVAFYEDRERNAWFGGVTRGLAKLSNRNVFRFPLAKRQDLMNDAAIASDENGHFWIMAPDGLMEIWRTGSEKWNTQHHHLRTEGLGGLFIGVVYDAGSNLLCLWDNSDRIEFYSIHPDHDQPSGLTLTRRLVAGIDLPAGIPVRVVADRQHRFYCSLYKFGIVVIDPRRKDPVIRSFASKDGLSENEVRTIRVDGRGSIWTGGKIAGTGILRLDSVESASPVIKHYTVEDGLCDNNVRAIFEDHLGRIWVGTRYGGLTIIDHGTFRTLTVKDGLLSNSIWSIGEDSSGRIWMATNIGLQSMLPGVPPAFTSYDYTFGSIMQSCAVNPRGLICAYATNDVTIFDFSRPSPPLPPPPVYISSVMINGEQIPRESALNFSSVQRNLAVEFAGISFASAGRIRYRYKLEETDLDWGQPTFQHSVTFASLRPGSYRFLVKAINSDGIESSRPAALEFTISPPFWQRWWFITLCLAAAASAIYVLYRLRVRQILEIENVRRRIATDLHDDVGADLTQIAIFSEILKPHLHDRNSQEILETIGATARRVIGGMSDLVWYIDPRHDTLNDLVARVEDLAGQLLRAKEISLTIDVAPAAASVSLSPDTRRELFLVMKEALHNAIRHASCSAISVMLSTSNGRLHVRMNDNGRGISPDVARTGHGLQNMKHRTEAIGGQFVMNSNPEEGTTLDIRVPLSAQARQTT